MIFRVRVLAQIGVATGHLVGERLKDTDRLGEIGPGDAFRDGRPAGELDDLRIEAPKRAERSRAVTAAICCKRFDFAEPGSPPAKRLRSTKLSGTGRPSSSSPIATGSQRLISAAPTQGQAIGPRPKGSRVTTARRTTLASCLTRSTRTSPTPSAQASCSEAFSTWAGRTTGPQAQLAADADGAPPDATDHRRTIGETVMAELAERRFQTTTPVRAGNELDEEVPRRRHDEEGDDRHADERGGRGRAEASCEEAEADGGEAKQDDFDPEAPKANEQDFKELGHEVGARVLRCLGGARHGSSFRGSHRIRSSLEGRGPLGPRTDITPRPLAGGGFRSARLLGGRGGRLDALGAVGDAARDRPSTTASP